MACAVMWHAHAWFCVSAGLQGVSTTFYKPKIRCLLTPASRIQPSPAWHGARMEHGMARAIHGLRGPDGLI